MPERNRLNAGADDFGEVRGLITISAQMSVTTPETVTCVSVGQANGLTRRSASLDLSRCGGQELPVYEILLRVAKCVTGINGRIDPRFAKLDRADESNRARRRAVCKRKVGMLIALPDERLDSELLRAVAIEGTRALPEFDRGRF